MSKLIKVKKVLLGITTVAAIAMTSLGTCTQVYAWGPGGSKEEIEVPVIEELRQEEPAPQSPIVEKPKQEESEPQKPVVEERKPEDITDEVYTVKAPSVIYNQDWRVNPNDWTYTKTQWTAGTATVEGHYGSDAEIKRMYELINEYRVANGKEPLKYNIKMNTVSMGADERAITSANYWEHWSYRFSENIAYTPVFYSGYDDMEMVEKVFEAWINSPGHRNNILNAGSTKYETAISVFYKKVEGGYERYWVQCFR